MKPVIAIRPRATPVVVTLALCAPLLGAQAAVDGKLAKPVATLAKAPAMADPRLTPSSPRRVGLVYGAAVVGTDAQGSTVVSAPILTSTGAATVTTGPVPPDAVASVTASLVPGNLVDWVPSGAGGDVAYVPGDASRTFNPILRKGTSSAAQFDTAKYGPEVTGDAGKAGPMVAAGWVYRKAGRTITVGDGRIVTADMAGRPYNRPIKRYEETYVVSPDVKVYNVDTSAYGASTVSTFDAIPVTANYDYANTSRQAAYFLFDRNYAQPGVAKVVAIWYFTPQSVSDGKPVWDVQTLSPLLADKGVDPVSGLPFVEINATSPSSAPYTRSTEPFAIVPGAFWYIGDNEVSSYLFKADMGTADPADDRMIKVDAGWPNSGYQYWKNIELVGQDPRRVTDVWLTHAHSDHYGTIIEQLRMADNAGLPIALWGSKEDVVGITADQQGNAWNIVPTLPSSQAEIRSRTTNFYEYDKWYDFGNVRIMVIWAPGHTTGATNMLFQVKNPVDGKFNTFGYQGGYGVNGLERPTTTNGWRRLAWQHQFSYAQQIIDVDYVTPQHTNQYPIVDVYQALKAYNRDPANFRKQLTMLDALRSKVYDSPYIDGKQVTSEFANQMEKRRSVISYRLTDEVNSSRKSIETSGPFKPGREAGLVDVQAKLLDGGKIVQGFVNAQNKNPRIPLLANGLSSTVDAYVEDPGGFFVQVAIDVQDAGYPGYLPEGFTQYSPGMDATITYQGGPVESTNAAKGTFHPPEYLRTQRLNSLAEAQAVLATIAKGQNVIISLTPASEIVVPADVTRTFR